MPNDINTDIVSCFTDELSGRPKINASSVCRLLAEAGICRLPNANHTYLRIRENFLEVIDLDEIHRILDSILSVCGSPELHHLVIKDHLKLINHKALALLPEFTGNLLNDGRAEIRIPVRNGIATASAAGKTMLPYEECPDYVWQHAIVPVDYQPIHPSEFNAIPIYLFLLLTCCEMKADYHDHLDLLQAAAPSPLTVTPDADTAGFSPWSKLVKHFDEQRWQALQATIGKALHTNREQTSQRKVIIFSEQRKPDDGNNGRTGKTLITKAIRWARPNSVSIDMRSKLKEDRYLFDQMNGTENVVVLDDLNPRTVPLTSLYGRVTGDFEIHRKYHDSYQIPAEKAPQLIITTNASLIGNDDSDIGRIWPMQLYKTFDTVCTPNLLNGGKDFMDASEWTNLEWNQLLNILLDCCVQYFRCDAHLNGCPEYQSNERELSIRAEISSEFYDWLDAWFEEQKTGNNSKTVVIKELRDSYETDTGNRLKNMLTRYLTKWAKHKGIKVIVPEAPVRVDGKPQRVIELSW